MKKSKFNVQSENEQEKAQVPSPKSQTTIE
jgi:hypothetical protein